MKCSFVGGKYMHFMTTNSCEYRSHWWVVVVVQAPQSSPYPPRSLSLKFCAQGQFLLGPCYDTSLSLGQGQPFDIASTLSQGLPSNP
jgi:hypothetical protein